MGLEKYRHKRDFSRTPEPSGERGASPSGRMYLIQKHAARVLHYDLRLELGGVLKSWAVPKGPCLDPQQKRLAQHVEDHPIEYGSFEGIIPAGEYGGGTVLLWDRGEWEPEGDPEKDYRRGRLSFRLHGEKLQGAWTLARMGGEAAEEGDGWLLIKRGDEAARAGDDGDFLQQHPRSVASGRTIEEVAADRDLVWHQGRAIPGAGPEAVSVPDPASLPGARPAPQPELISPQLARLVDAVPGGDEWLHEIKLDGYRLVCTLRNGTARLWTRTGQDWTERFAAVARAAAALPVGNAVFDGEVTVLDPGGKSDFQALQNHLREGGRGALVYYLFDVVHCEGFDLSRVPLTERKEFLRRLLASPDPAKSIVRYSDHIRGDGERVLRHACRFGLEGIVSKRADSSYVQRRSSSWLKVKCQQRQEFVIGGFSEPGGSRSGFGALLVGYHDQDGQLIYAGKVGTGFDEATLGAVGSQLRQKEIAAPPFRDPPRGAEARGVHWVRPELVAEVEFTEWTGDGRLRHPSFKGWREDKSPAEVGREREPPPEKTNTGEGKRRGEAGASAARGPVIIAGIPISNPGKILYPEQGVSKRALAEYYERVGERILPFIARRPLTIVRCPHGRGQKCFYQKHLNESVPSPVRGIPVPEKEGEGLYLVIDDLPGLITLVQLGAMEFHPWGSREDKLEYPDMVTFDLDPGPEVAWEDVIFCAGRLRERLADLGLQSFVKTSGGKGLHVVLPLVPSVDWDVVKEFTRAIAEEIARKEPGRYVTTMTKAHRKGKIFIDFFRNSRGSTSVAPYSSRAKHGAPVSAPLGWNELSPDVGPADLTIENVPARLGKLKKDPWAEFFSIRQSITKAVRRELGF